MIEIFYYATPNGRNSKKCHFSFDPKEVACLERKEGPNPSTRGWALKIVFKNGYITILRHETDFNGKQIKDKGMLVDGEPWSFDKNFAALEERILIAKK